MRATLGVVAVAVVAFAAGVGVQRYLDARRDGQAAPASGVATGVDFEHEPLWAYGFSAVRKPGETAAPQNPPSRRLRSNEPAEEQTRGRSVEGSRASYSLVDIR